MAEDHLKTWEVLFQRALALITARDIFDLAMVIEHEPPSLTQIRPILRDRGPVILDRIARHTVALQEAFDALESLDYQRNFEDCVALITQTLKAAR